MGPQPIDYPGAALASRESSFSDKLILIFRPYRILTPEGEILKFSQIFPSLVQVKVTVKEVAGVKNNLPSQV